MTASSVRGSEAGGAPVVDTSAGPVRGATVAGPDDSDVHRFLGVPYAAPPVGDLRWREPRPAHAWAGVRDAHELRAAAPQTEALDDRLPGFRLLATSEDCLTANIWAPALDGARPVMVWLHGGGYSTGGSAQPVYDATRLALEGDVVVVTVNYRLGALGFLAPEGDGVANCGLRDQLAALEWVRTNAAAFGGDPQRITVFGESAGAGSILHLLASPRRGTAFGRAIVQSAQPLTLPADRAAEVAERFAKHLELGSADAGALRAAPVARLLDAQAATLADMLGKVGPMAFAPVLDGEVCDLSITDAIESGRADGIDLVIGTTRDELSLFSDPRDATLEDGRLLRRIAALGPVVDPEVVLATYRSAHGAATPNGALWDAIRTDAMMRVPMLRVADVHSARQSATYVYRFDWEAPEIGAAHAVDVPFTFGNFDREGWDAAVGCDDRAMVLGQEIRTSWTSFAASGTPDAPAGAGEWPRYDVARRPTLIWGPDGARLEQDPAGATRRSWMS